VVTGRHGAENGREKGRSGVGSFSGNKERKKGVCLGQHSVEVEEVKHGAVGMESVAIGGSRCEVVEEGEEGGRGEGERVEGDKVGDVARGKGREDAPESWVLRVILVVFVLGILDCFGDCA